MAAPPSIPTPSKSRGHTLFDRQAQLHAYDSDKTSNNSSSTISDLPLPLHKSIYPNLSTPPVIQYHQQQQNSPLLVHHRSPLSTSEGYSQINNNVQLIGIHPRPQSTYIKESTVPTKEFEELIETDFPFIENSAVQEPDTPVNQIVPSDSLCCAMIEQAFDYLQTHDDDDDVVHEKQQEDPSFNVDCYYNNEENSDGNDSVDTIDLDATTSTNHQNDSKFYYPYSYYYFNNLILSVCFN